MSDGNNGESFDPSETEDILIEVALQHIELRHKAFMEACVSYSSTPDIDNEMALFVAAGAYEESNYDYLNLLQIDPKITSLQYFVESGRFIIAQDRRRRSELNIWFSTSLFPDLPDPFDELAEDEWNSEGLSETDLKQYIYVQLEDTVTDLIEAETKTIVEFISGTET